jgi:predicted dehydrogenase
LSLLDQMSKNQTRCRWGILGAAVIARKFWQSVRLAENATLVAVASRQPARATEFCKECSRRFAADPMPVSLGSYQELLQRPDIDAVYIPLPTGVREKWVLAAAENGKHVLCEKPCAVSESSMGAMVDACERAGVQFMDNVMFMHSARLNVLGALLADKEKIGQLRQIHSQFSFCADENFFSDNIRLNMAMEPWGCLGDLGWYNIRIALMAKEGQLPVSVIGRNLDANWDRPTTEFSGEMNFADGTTASFYCSFTAANQQWVHFSGTKGSALIEDFALPWYGNRSQIRYNSPQFNRSGYDFNYENQAETLWVDEFSNAHSGSQEVNLVRHFSELVLNGKREPFWTNICQKTQTVMDALLRSAKEGHPILFSDL